MGSDRDAPQDPAAQTAEPCSIGRRVLVTGMSGTGKSAALERLAERGHCVVDTDSDEWSHWVELPDGTCDWIWRDDAITELLTGHRHGALFVAGCKSNQGRFYPLFDHVALLSAPAEVILARIAARTNNPYGKDPEERAMVLRYLAEVEPLLRATATVEIDASASLSEVVRQLERLGQGVPQVHDKRHWPAPLLLRGTPNASTSAAVPHQKPAVERPGGLPDDSTA